MNILIEGQTFTTPEIHRGIGIYTKNVINNMLKMNYEHTWYICVADDTNLNELDPWARNKLNVIKRPEAQPGTDYTKNRQFTQALREIVIDKQIDLIWIPNMLMVNVLALEEMLPCRICVFVHDIIPYVFPVKEWAAPVVEEYHRRLAFLKDNDIELLFNSNASKQDFFEHIGSVSKWNVSPLAADPHRFYRKRISEDVHSNIILFTGGFDYRKNIDGAIDAFELALKKYSADVDFNQSQLYIVGSTDAATHQKYEEILCHKKLQSKVKLTGYLSDEDLSDLYKKADVFFFPSLYEGFGLPLLEGMLGGAYVVSANNSSLPEVCGGHGLLFDAGNLDEAADALYQGFCAALNESTKEKNIRQTYALTYSWETTAQITLDFWEEAVPSILPDQKQKLALLTPWPEQETGIANFEYKIVPYLQKFFDIDVFSTVSAEKCRSLEGVRIYPLQEFKHKRREYVHALYQIGNNTEFHKEIFETLEICGGIAEIHDYVLTPFFYHSYFLKGQKNKFKELLVKGYGESGHNAFLATKQNACQPDMYTYPMSHTVAQCADKVIFHNHWSAKQLNVKNASIIPLPCFDLGEKDTEGFEAMTAQMKKKYGIGDELVIGCFGWVNANKRPQVVLNAVSALIQRNYSVKLCFWGKAPDDEILHLAKELGLEDRIVISGYIDGNEYEAALQLTDIVVNLRYPSMGESSGTLCETFKAGKPVIVSDINQYQEFPDEVCWKLPVCNQEEELLTAYLVYLIDHPEVKDVLGKNARNYADNVLNPEKIAVQYYKLLVNANEK